jgi:hypothetical protein
LNCKVDFYEASTVTKLVCKISWNLFFCRGKGWEIEYQYESFNEACNKFKSYFHSFLSEIFKNDRSLTKIGHFTIRKLFLTRFLSTLDELFKIDYYWLNTETFWDLLLLDLYFCSVLISSPGSDIRSNPSSRVDTAREHLETTPPIVLLPNYSSLNYKRACFHDENHVILCRNYLNRWSIGWFLHSIVTTGIRPNILIIISVDL